VIVEANILDGAPIRAISWLKPEDSWDSGYALFSGAPGQIGETTVVCLHCIIGEHPEIGRSLDHAREHGEWISDDD
jgi:hypothetical protein